MDGKPTPSVQTRDRRTGTFSSKDLTQQGLWAAGENSESKIKYQYTNGDKMKFLVLSILSLITFSQAHAFEGIAHDISINYQKVTRDTSGWGYGQLMSDMGDHDKHIILSAQNDEVSAVLASLNPSLSYCCTTTAYQEVKMGFSLKMLPVSDLQCKPYPTNSHSFLRLPGHCNFSAD